MLSQEENERLTRVGPGTPMGELMRRYWHPVGATSELDRHPTKSVRILGEDLVLYREPSGGYGLVGDRCAHRRTSLVWGVPEEGGLRCMYHGWKYDGSGACVEQPFEETVNPEGRFKSRVRIAGYPVEELGGLLFAYFGPEPVPLLPRWEPLTWANCVRDIALTELPCSWLQCQENSLDPVHVEWLHGYFGKWMQQRSGNSDPLAAPTIGSQRLHKVRHLKIGFDAFEYGIIKRRVLEGFSEGDEDWAVGHPMLFPNTLLVGNEMQATMQWRVPADDTHTYHVSYYVFRAAPGSVAPEQTSVPHRYVPLKDEKGEFIVDMTFNQDYMAWITQGPVYERDLERLGESDVGIILFRQILRQQLEVVLDGGEPMNVFRDGGGAPIELPMERVKFGDRTYLEYSPAEAGQSGAIDDINRVLATWAPLREAVGGA